MGQQQLLLIILGVIIVGLAIAIGLSLFTANSIQANKDAIINDVNNIAANAYQYRIRTASMGGGNNSYVGYVIPSRLSSNSNATYVPSGQTATACVITGSSIANAGCTVTGTLNVNGGLTLTFAGSDFQ
jgi:type II secretory pathway pseudopilin PulG